MPAATDNPHASVSLVSSVVFLFFSLVLVSQRTPCLTPRVSAAESCSQFVQLRIECPTEPHFRQWCEKGQSRLLQDLRFDLYFTSVQYSGQTN